MMTMAYPSGYATYHNSVSHNSKRKILQLKNNIVLIVYLEFRHKMIEINNHTNICNY